MSTAPLKSENDYPDVSSDKPRQSSKLARPQRILACVLCQQRKIKCSRQFPCSNCIKSGAQCVPSPLTRPQRKRRFPERELLERLHRYEDLLRQNNITFEPLHRDLAKQKASLIAQKANNSDDDRRGNDVPDVSSPSTTVKSESAYETKNIWHAMSQGFRDPEYDSDSSYDDVRENVVRKAWEESFRTDDHLLFGSRTTNVDLSTLHPDPVKIFRLWQVYLDNINPLLKVTHTPSLQGRIIEAASNVANIDPNLEALMFSIYCISILSLSDENCETMFGSSKDEILKRQQYACQQALVNCGFLRTSNRDCLTALYFYLISARPSTVPQSLSSLLGIAMRIAQRMGIHSESNLAKCDVVEAEMRRRLWWSLMLFDTRLVEMSNSKVVTLDPTWDCSIPLNVNDSDLRPEMKRPPAAIKGKPTEAIFAVVRGEVGEVIRHTSFYLDFSTPALKPIAKHIQNDADPNVDVLVKLEEMIEEQYLQYCDQENPLHFMTIWTTRAHLAKCRLMDYHARYSDSVRRTEAQHDTATAFALRVLECDTKVMTSPLTKGFLWLNQLHFPFPAYLQITQDLRRRPLCKQAWQAWEAMSDSYETWLGSHSPDESPFFHIFSGMVLQAWKACEAAVQQSGETLTPPRIVSSIRYKLAQAAGTGTDETNVTMDMDSNDFQMPMSMPTTINFDDQSLPYNMGMEDNFAGMGPEMFLGISSQGPLDIDMAQLDWTAFGGRPGWGGY